MWAAAVVKAEIVTDPGAGLRNAGIGVQVDLFVFDGAPEALYEDVVAPSPLPFVTGRCLQANTERHADLDLAGGQHLDEVGGRELAALIRVEYLGRAVTCQRLLHSFYAEVGLQRDRHSPCQDTPGEPIQHGSQVDEAPRC